MKRAFRPSDPPSDRNQGEGDRTSARRYNEQVREFVAEGKVDEAAEIAEAFVEREPAAANSDERAARKRPIHPIISIDELVAKGRTVAERVRPIVRKALDRIRDRLGGS